MQDSKEQQKQQPELNEETREGVRRMTLGLTDQTTIELLTRAGMMAKMKREALLSSTPNHTSEEPPDKALVDGDGHEETTEDQENQEEGEEESEVSNKADEKSDTESNTESNSNSEVDDETGDEDEGEDGDGSNS
ncbi:hypothetical protein FDECE_3119 [Fusarium decemcellulare]|nr:hypothetical protein FDECE_3119 [Fusarium decemcellulare]